MSRIVRGSRPITSRTSLLIHQANILEYNSRMYRQKNGNSFELPLFFVRFENCQIEVEINAFALWSLTDSNRRPSACKADALNQLS